MEADKNEVVKLDVSWAYPGAGIATGLAVTLLNVRSDVLRYLNAQTSTGDRRPVVHDGDVAAIVG